MLLEEVRARLETYASRGQASVRHDAALMNEGPLLIRTSRLLRRLLRRLY